MSLFNCVRDSCARVVFKEYLAPVVRFRYQGEDWIEIAGDDYTIENNHDLSLLGYYKFVYRIHKVINGNAYTGTLAWSDEITTSGSVLINGVSSWRLEVSPWGTADYFYSNGLYTTWHWDTRTSRWTHNGFAQFRVEIIDLDGQIHKLNVGSTGGLEAIKLINNSPPVCKFSVFNQGELVYERTNVECPEVEKLDCRLSDKQKEVIIFKTPWLTAVDVVNYGRDSTKINGVPYPVPSIYPIPDNCLNIYRFEGLELFPNIESDGNDPVFNDFIAQICSAPGCPPPVFQVVCGCETCEYCPEGTCAVHCGDHICCADPQTGEGVKTIPIEDYCGGT